MPDDLQIIDTIERIKAWLLAQRPQLSEIAQRRLEDFQADHAIGYYKELLLAALTGADARAPSQLRQLSRVVRRWEEAPEQSRHDIIAEDQPVFHARMGRARRQAVVEGLEALDQIEGDARQAGRSLGQRLRDASHPEEARKFLRKMAPAIKGLDAYRVLAAWNWPLILPDSRRQTLFFRLGALPRQASSAQGMARMVELGETIQRLTSEPLQTLDLMTGVFTGALSGFPRPLARCAVRPRCDDCPASSGCEHFKHREKPSGDEPRATIKDWDVHRRPRERLARHGPERLSDAELLAILLRTGTAKATAMELSHQILKRFGGLKGIDEAILAEICAAKGVGPVKGVTLKAAFELGKRLVREADDPGEFIHTSYDIFRRFQHRFGNVKKEEFHLLCLNTKHEVIHESMISLGSLSSNVVHPREAYRDAIRQAAAAVVFVHNHPSGDPAPSEQDQEVTRRLRESGKVLGIQMLDHVIVGQNRYYSFEVGRIVDLDVDDNDEEEE
jgi:DNA repair protein RadC